MRLLIRSIGSPLSDGRRSSPRCVLQLLGQRVRIRHRFVAGVTATDVRGRLIVDQRSIVEQLDHVILPRSAARQYERGNVLRRRRALQSTEVTAFNRAEERYLD